MALGLQGWLVAAFLLVGVIASLTILVVVLPTLESSVREDRAKRESDRLGAILRGELESRLLRDPVGVDELRGLAQDLRAASGADIRLTYRPGAAFVRVETTVQWPPTQSASDLLDEASGLARGYSLDGRLAAPFVRLSSQSTGSVLLVRGAQTLSGIAPEVAIVRRRVIVAMVLVLSLASLLGVLLARRLGGRMRGLSRTAATLAGGDLGARSPELGLVPTELVVLRDSLDGMAARLQSFVGAITDERDRDRAMVGSLAEGVVTVAPDDTVMVANDAANRMLGLDEGADGRGRLDALPAPLMDAVRSSRAGREVAERELTLPGGLEIEAQVSPMAGRDEGGTVLTLRDVTDERRLERARRDLVANVSHELKTPIAALRGFLELLEGDRVRAEDRREFIAAMTQETGRLERLVEEQLQLARLDAGALPLELGDVDLGDLARAVVDARIPLAEREGLRLEVSALDGDGPTVLADAARIEQVLLILLDNATRHTPAGGRVDVVVERDGSARRALLRVRDTGEGIPAEDLPFIFDRFYRGDPSREGRSAGLGLAIARGLVAAHRGTVSVESALGTGTTFTVELPLVSGSAVTVEERIPAALRMAAPQPPPPPPRPPVA